MLGIDVGEIVADAVRALVDLVIPDFGADWVSQLVTWLVALPVVTGEAFPSLNRYADQLTAVGFGLLGATFVAGVLQLWAGGLTGAAGAGESVKRAAIAAGALVSYPVVLEAVLVATNVLTAQMIRHPLVQDGLDKAFGAALIVGAVTGGLSLGLAVGAAIVVLYFIAALIVLKLGLTTALSVADLSGPLVWGLYALPQTAWLARAWTAAVVTAIAIPVAWACVFAAAALLAADTLVFDGGGRHNNALGDTLSYLVKPLAAVACFWLAYRAPGFLLGLARSAGLGGVVTGRSSGSGGASSTGGHGQTRAGRRPDDVVRQGVQTNADRFRALTHLAGRALPALPVGRSAGSGSPPSPASSAGPGQGAPAPHGRVTAAARAVGAAVGPAVRANRWWRELPARGRSLAEGQAPHSDPAQKGPGEQGGGRTRTDATAPPRRSAAPRATRPSGTTSVARLARPTSARAAEGARDAVRSTPGSTRSSSQAGARARTPTRSHPARPATAPATGPTTRTSATPLRATARTGGSAASTTEPAARPASRSSDTGVPRPPREPNAAVPPRRHGAQTAPGPAGRPATAASAAAPPRTDGAAASQTPPRSIRTSPPAPAERRPPQPPDPTRRP